MQPLQDPLAIQHRSLDVEDYIDIVRRHRAWILGPTFAGLVLSVVVAFLWPDTYISSAIIRITPPQVPERMVPMAMNTDLSQRVNQMAQSITSRANLTNIINTYQLYPREKRRLPMEDIIELMKTKAISVIPLGQGVNSAGQQRTLAFQVQFKYDNRFTAQKVCTDLVSRFIDENVRERTSSTAQMKDFVGDQWEARKRELEGIEDQLAKFKMANVGKTPEQQGATISGINALESRMSTLNGSLSRVGQDRLQLESQLNILRDQLKQIQVPSVENAAPTPRNDRLVLMEREIANFETRLQAEREKYQETHPNIRTAVANLAILKKERDKLQKEQDDEEKKDASSPRKASLRPETVREIRMYEGNIQQLQSRIEGTRLEEENYRKALNEAERQARNLQGALNTMPANEKEYEQLRMQAMLARRDFEEVDRLRNQAATTVELENRKQNEKLELLDPPNTPQNPTEPNRWLIVLGGALGGLLLGICMAGAREMKDTTLKNLKDVRAYTQLNVLGCIPLLENDLVVRRRRRLAWLAWSTACLAGVAIMTGSILFYFQGK